MTEQKNKRSSLQPGGVLIRIALVLFCLVMFSTYLMAGLFARYTAAGTGADAARVAGFDVQMNDDLGALTVQSTRTDSDKYNFSVVNHSEVAVRYEMYVVYANKQMDTVGVTPVFDVEGGVLAPQAEAEHTLSFEVAWDIFTEKAVGESKTVEIPFSVVVNVEQVD